MRYLVVIHGESAKVRRRDLSVSHALHRGDAVVLDAKVFRVWAVIDAPTKLGHDAIVLCGAADPVGGRCSLDDVSGAASECMPQS